MRGITAKYKHCLPNRIPIYDSNDEVDFLAHFPAGSKSTVEGSALRSLIEAAGKRGWVPYEPTNPSYKFKTGPCGDPLKKHPRDHERGGKYFNDGKMHFSYHEGGTISIDLCITTHHNGYSEFRVCDASRCGGEITNECLRNPRICPLLERAYDSSCESRSNPDWKCGPIDKVNPSRWYHPCETKYEDHFYGNGKIKYKLPKGFSCKHCVLQHYWVAANACNPPGVWEYFTGDNGPRWGNCPGQGEAKGGYRRWPQTCGGTKYHPEEYFQCADIEIKRKAGGHRNQNPRNDISTGSITNSSPLQRVSVFADGKERNFLKEGSNNEINIRSYRQITFYAKISPENVSKIEFFIDNTLVWSEKTAPYYFFGNRRNAPKYWKHPVLNTYFKLRLKMYLSSNTGPNIIEFGCGIVLRT